MGRHVVDGATRMLGIVGHPIVQVRAPAVWTGLFQAHGLNMLCVPFHVLPEDLVDFYAGARTMKNLAGMIVTIPYKPASAGLMDALTDRARIVHAVNFIPVGDARLWTAATLNALRFSPYLH